MYVAGMASIAYCLATGSLKNARLETWCQVKLSFSIASNQAALASFWFGAPSKETPIISRPLSLYFSYTFTTFGFSFLQGPHQAAQKSMIVTFPLISFKLTNFPSGFGAEKFGAILPTSIVTLDRFPSIAFPNLLETTSSENALKIS